MAFLTDLDSRAAIKGSRDPLATQSIWVPLGRMVVGNLTTVSTSVRDFTVLLLGFWLLERAKERGPEEPDVSLFLKWEQLAGYVRVEHDLGPFRGVEQASKRRSEGSKLTLSADRAHQILSNQKTYGLWGLYTVPGRSSGLLDADPLRLTRQARDFVENNYLPALAKHGFRDGEAIVRLLMAPTARIDVERKERPLVAAIAALLHPERFTAAERQFFEATLVRGGPDNDTEGRQTRLADVLHGTTGDDEFAFNPRVVDKLARAAKDRATSGSLAIRLERIRHCETMLAPATALFQYLLACDRKRPAELADDVRKTWGASLQHLDLGEIEELRNEITKVLSDGEVAARWMDLAADLRQGRYEDVIVRLIAHNTAVMKQRGGAAPWIEVRQGRLHVAFRDEDGALPARTELPALWRSSYFLDSLREVVKQVRGAAA